MKALKKAWITKHDADLFALTLESATVYPEYRRIKFSEQVFPDRDSPNERHTTAISLLEWDDLVDLYDVIGKFLTNGL